MNATIDNTATAWARKLIANGADPHTIAAWMQHELSLDPFAFRELMTRDEIARVYLRRIKRSLLRIEADTHDFRSTITSATAAISALPQREQAGMPAHVEAAIKAAIAREVARDAH